MELVKKKTSQGKAWLDKDGIIHQVYASGTDLRLEDSLEELKLYKTEYCNGVKRPIMVDITNVKTVSKEARDIYSSNKTADILAAAALIIGNPVSRIMGNFFTGINKTGMPVRMFTNPGDAKKWLKVFLP
jgi:hypothetical protein